MASPYSRREFIRNSVVTGAAGLAGGLLPAPARAQQSANAKLGIAVIGAGGMGGYSVDQALTENLVALCDVDDNILAGVIKEKMKDRSQPRVYYDFRKMLDECEKQIDVVLIATPDHVHGPAAIRAIEMGKHTFCQKPMAHNIYECNALAKAAKRKKVLTQMGNQGYCGEKIRTVAEFIQSGAIGNVVETHTILGRNFGGSAGRPPAKPLPSGLHWDEWIGPAPYREYHENLHPFNWRNYKAFGTGTIGDMACHHVAVPFMALKLAEVKKFTLECINTTGGSDEMYPQDNVVCYHIPARPKVPAFKMFVYDHQGLKPEIMKEVEKQEKREFGEFTLFVGDKGMIGSDGLLIPLSRHDEIAKPSPTLPRAHGGPIEDLYWCIRNNGVPASNFPDAASPLTTIALAGHLAQFAEKGSKLEWDMEKMRCTNHPQANQWVRRSYRKGWEV
jgi:predicted dehydrogenase